MNRGILYVMTTVVPGLIKLGKTGIANFESRMYQLERHGYSNVVGLKRKFAIEVEDYNEKEALLIDIFSKSRVPGTELFALDIDLVTQQLSSFDGKQVFPVEKTKEEVFDEATIERAVKADAGILPDGKYFLQRKVRGFGDAIGRAIVKDGIFTVQKGSICAPVLPGYVPKARKDAFILDNVLQEDLVCTSPSSAGWVVIGRTNNGWTEWRDSEGNKIEIYQKTRSVD